MNPDLQRILLVDDDQIYLLRLAKALRDRGCTIATAETAEAAPAAAAALKPQAAVLDLKLPGATAMEAVRQGAWDYLTKPADADQILTALTRDPTQAQKEAEITPSSLDRMEWEHIQRVLNDNEGNVTQTAAALGLHRRSLQRKLRKEPPQT